MDGSQAVEAYLIKLPEPAQVRMRQIRALLSAAAPDAGEQLKYGMPTVCRGRESLLYYAAWKAHIGLYPVYRGDAAFEAVIAPYRDKKDTLRFPLSQPIPLDIIDRVIAHQVARIAAA